VNEYPLPGKNDAFEYVVSIFVMEHLENHYAFARKIARVLKPGGLVFIIVPNTTSIWARIRFLFTANSSAFTIDNNHTYFISKDTLYKPFFMAGFSLHTEHESETAIPYTRIQLPKNKLFYTSRIVCFRKQYSGNST
jgi:2-polyprenyl-3-methyl-5-hydroxy-6-metoxy-1,4-benzoquinol methylase